MSKGIMFDSSVDGKMHSWRMKDCDMHPIKESVDVIIDHIKKGEFNAIYDDKEGKKFMERLIFCATDMLMQCHCRGCIIDFMFLTKDLEHCGITEDEINKYIETFEFFKGMLDEKKK